MKFDLGSKQTRTETVTVADGSFTVEVRNPTFAELIKDAPLTKDYQEGRLRASVVGWSGVEDANGEAIPFSWENLQRICEIDVSIFWQLLAIARKNFSEARAARKNSPDASAVLSADAILKAGGLSGKPILNSGDLPGSPVPLESVSNVS